MNIRNYILATIFISMLLASCQKIDPVNGTTESIEFKIDVADVKVVKTKTTLLETLPTDENSPAFGVLGYCVPNIVGTDKPNYSGASAKWEDKQHNSYPDVFYNTSVKYKDGAWKYEDIELWRTNTANNSNPASYTYSFFAYYPQGNGWSVDTGSKALGAPTFSFTMPFSSNDVNTKLDDSAIPDAMIATTYDHIRADGAVPLTFSHILAGINIKAVNYDSRDITITSVTLTGTFNKKVTINFKDGSMSYNGTYKGTFTFNNGNHSLGKDASINLNGGKTILLLSNSGLGSSVSLNIKYEVNGVSETQEHSISLDKLKPVSGSNYALTLNFVNGTITLSFESEQEWEDGGDSNSTIK